jgi:hypothetical protein
MSIRNILGGKGRPVLKADNVTAIYEPIVWKMWKPQHLTTLWASTACYRDTFTFYVYKLERERKRDENFFLTLERTAEVEGIWKESTERGD